MGKCMTKEELFAPIRECYGELREALKGSDLDKIRQLTLEVHAMVHPAEISGRKEKTIADYVLEYMMDGISENIRWFRVRIMMSICTMQVQELCRCAGSSGIHTE